MPIVEIHADGTTSTLSDPTVPIDPAASC